MALNKDTITINLAKTVGDKNDDKITPADQMAVVRDARFQKDYALEKRNGLTAQGTTFLGDPGFVNPVAMGSGGPKTKSFEHENQLVMVNNGNLFSQYTAQDKWIFRGTCLPIGINTSTVDSGQGTSATAAINFIDSASVNGITVAISQVNSGGTVSTPIYVIEESTGLIISKNTITATAGTEAAIRVLPFASSVWIATQDATRVFARQINLATGSIGTAVTVVSGTAPTIISSAVTSTSSTVGEAAFILYRDGVDIKVNAIKSNGSVPTVGTVTTGLAANLGNATIMCSPSVNPNKFYVASAGQGTGTLEAYTLSSTYSQNFTTAFGTSSTATYTFGVTVGLSPINSSDIYVYYDNTTRSDAVSGSSDSDFVNMLTFSSAGSLSSFSTYGRGFNLAGECLVDTSRKTILLPVLYLSSFQKTLMLADTLEGKVQSTYIVGKCLYRTASGLYNFYALNNSNNSTSRQCRPLTSGTATSTYRMVNGQYLVDFELVPENAAQSQYYAKTNHLTGGILWAYDGYNVSEHGFLIAPENFTAGSATSGGGTSSAGSYLVTFVYRWRDRNGQDYRSAPAVSQSVTTGGGAGAGFSYTLSVPPITNRDPSTVLVEVYSTIANGATFFLQATGTMSSASTTITGTVGGGAIASTTRQLYTTGGILENASNIGACSSVWFFKERLCANAGDDPQAVAYSKTNVTGEPINFAEELQFRVDADEKEVSAGIQMDDKMIVAKKDKLYVISGNGANDTGQGDTFQPPMLIAADVGCEVPNSMVLYSNGVIFDSTKGIYNLSRGLSVSYIGDRVEDYNSFRVAEGVLMEDQNEIRFALQNGTTGLVYNYFFDRWDLFSNYQADSACIWQNSLVLARASGKVLVENSNYYDVDSGTASYNVYVETPWLKLKGIQDFQRVYSLMFLGEYFTPNTFKVELSYNYVPTVVDTFNFDSQLAVNDPPYQFQAFPTLQKCQSIKIAITIIPSTGSQRGINLNEIGAVVGLKQGLNKIPAVKRA